MNLNKIAVEISKREGGKVNLPIAQVKEVLRHALEILDEMNPVTLWDELLQRQKRHRKRMAKCIKRSKRS